MCAECGFDLNTVENPTMCRGGSRCGEICLGCRNCYACGGGIGVQCDSGMFHEHAIPVGSSAITGYWVDFLDERHVVTYCFQCYDDSSIEDDDDPFVLQFVVSA